MINHLGLGWPVSKNHPIYFAYCAWVLKVSRRFFECVCSTDLAVHQLFVAEQLDMIGQLDKCFLPVNSA